MRIIAGRFKGRTFTPPIDPRVTRPTTDLAKESLFNILVNQIEFADEMHVLDLFAGSGSVSYEFMSRGIGQVTCVEMSAPLIRFIRQTAFVLGVKNEVETVKTDVFKWIPTAEGQQFDLIFADPPYAQQSTLLLPDLIFKHQLLKPNGIFILEHDTLNRFTAHPNLTDERNYGKTVFSFFEHQATDIN
jgi:16S rRNA (guanine966-N2)-methyltransferase